MQGYVPLRGILLFDAATCVAMGIALTAGSGFLARSTALPPDLLLIAGLTLFPIALFMAGAAIANWPWAIWLVIAGNVLWAAASLGLLVSGWVEPNGFGYALVAAQALVVAALAALEHAALKGTAAALA